LNYEWQRAFAWLPVNLVDGRKVWRRHVEWRIRRCRSLYFELDYRLPSVEQAEK